MNFQYEPLGDEYRFQAFLKDLFNVIYATETFEEYGSKGNLQHGIDIYSPILRTGIQAKKKDLNRNKKLILKELLNDLSETLEQVKNFPFPIEKLFFATTIKKDITLQKACFNASISHGINVILFSWDEIQEKLPDCHSVRNKYFPHLHQANLQEAEISKKLKKIKKLLSMLEVKKSTEKKQYRDIPQCEILLPEAPENIQKMLIASIIKVSLYETFSKTSYKKFGCLINFSATYTQFSDGSSGPGLQLISGEVIFLGHCSRLVKELQYNPENFWSRMDSYDNNLHFKNIKFRMELLRMEGLNSYEFEIDGQTASYNINAKEYEDLDYEKLNSLSAVMPFIAQITKPGINIIDIDKIKNHAPFMKLFYHFLNRDSFKPKLLKINVDDFDDWDYEYNLSDNQLQ